MRSKDVTLPTPYPKQSFRANANSPQLRCHASANIPIKFVFMLQKICRALLFNCMGWKESVSVKRPQKCIICVAPHTSNGDFIIGKLYYSALGLTSNFLMKKEWFFWPFGAMFRHMGGIPVIRSKHTSLTDQLAEAALRADSFYLAVTPEGTRSKVTTWKKGFYFIALKANIPIMLYAIDYGQKRLVCDCIITPSGDVDADMRTIMDYYKQFTAKHPEKFALDEAYS